MTSVPLVAESFPSLSESSALVSGSGGTLRDNDRVDGFLDFRAGFSVVAFLRFLDVRADDPVPARLSAIPFMVSFKSLINLPGPFADGLTDLASESSSRWGTSPLSSLDSSLWSESSSSSSFAAEGVVSSSGEDSFSVVLEMGLSSSTSGSDPSSRGSAGFGRSFGYLSPILATVVVSVTSVSCTSLIFGMWSNMLSLYHAMYWSAARRPCM